MIHFLTLSEVLFIYENQIRLYGGAYGVRDLNLLHSAIYVPQSTYDNNYLHKSIPEMAAAYAFHICGNHALLDGNKRVALASALVFLDINGYELTCTENEAYRIMMKVAKNEISKQELTIFFEKNSSIY
jgi:death-on-curing protein